MTTTRKKKYRPARLIRCKDAEAWRQMDAHAKAEGLSFNAWALAVLLSKVKYVKREEAAGRR